MADHLVRIHGTEQDRYVEIHRNKSCFLKVRCSPPNNLILTSVPSSSANCSFFTKMGACRHGDKCDRRHNRPTESPTVLFPNMYTAPPQFRPGPHGDIMVSDREMDEAFEEFYVDAFVEFSKIGAIEELHVCANPGVHLAGNVYLKFANEAQAADALKRFNGRLYDGKPLRGELCPVTDFGDARCRQFSSGSCDRRMCNFLHLKEPGNRIQDQLYRWQLEEWKKNRHLERPPLGAPPTHRERHGYGDRFEDRRGGFRRDDRRERRYDDHRRFSDSRGPPSPRRQYGEPFDSDPFGRDMRSGGGAYNEGRSRYDQPDSSEMEIEAKLAQVRNALAAHQGEPHPYEQSRKRERPEFGFDHEGPEAKFSKYEERH